MASIPSHPPPLASSAAAPAVSSVEERLFRSTAGCSFPAATTAPPFPTHAKFMPRNSAARFGRGTSMRSHCTPFQSDGSKGVSARALQGTQSRCWHSLLTNASWTRLLLLALAGYALGGALVAGVLHASRRPDLDAPLWHGDVPVWAQRWSEGVLLLLLHSTSEPETLGQVRSSPLPL